MAHNGNGHITSNGYDDEDKPMLLMKKSIDSQGNGLTALINKQLQGEIELDLKFHDAFICCLAYVLINKLRERNYILHR